MRGSGALLPLPCHAQSKKMAIISAKRKWFIWREPDSNRQPEDYETSALPVALSRDEKCAAPWLNAAHFFRLIPSSRQSRPRRVEPGPLLPHFERLQLPGRGLPQGQHAKGALRCGGREDHRAERGGEGRQQEAVAKGLILHHQLQNENFDCAGTAKSGALDLIIERAASFV